MVPKVGQYVEVTWLDHFTFGKAKYVSQSDNELNKHGETVTVGKVGRVSGRWLVIVSTFSPNGNMEDAEGIAIVRAAVKHIHVLKSSPWRQLK